jgi:hypothetical protein
MKETISIFVVMCVIAIMTSCSTGKNNGLVNHGCGGLARLPKTHR